MKQSSTILNVRSTGVPPVLENGRPACSSNALNKTTGRMPVVHPRLEARATLTDARATGGLRAFNRFLRTRGVAITIWCVLLLGLAVQMPRGDRRAGTQKSSQSAQSTTTATQRAVSSSLTLGAH